MAGTIPTVETAVMLIKPRNSTGPLEYFNGPSSSAYLPDLVKKAHDGRQIFVEYLNILPEERKLFREPDKLFTVQGVDMETLILRELEIDIKQD